MLQSLTKVIVKGRWRPHEDKELIRAVYQQLELLYPGEETIPEGFPWIGVANKMTSRTSKQCRERWVNNLDPSIIRRPWSLEEDKIILHLQNQMKGKWVKISSYLRGRSENQVKLRYRSLKSKNNKNNMKRKWSESYSEYSLEEFPVEKKSRIEMDFTDDELEDFLDLILPNY